MFLVIILLNTLTYLNPGVHCLKSKEILHQKKFPPCRACRVFIDSFKKGMEQTARGKFEGGDTAWEEQKLGSYSNSEIRLTEIQEKICSDIEEGKDQCYSIHEEYDSVLEEWWFHKQRNEHELFDFFCIERLKYCCPSNHYGENCTPCDGYPDNICSRNGKCGGAGTRKGNGECICHTGYNGTKCDQCAEGYFELFRDENKLKCAQCHSSCDGSCRKAGPEGCIKCKKGWLLDSDKGCVDIDECHSSTNPCKSKQFCRNNVGSYACINCDAACKSCTEEGPKMCKECADGFIMSNTRCTNDKVEVFKHFASSYILYFAVLATFVFIFIKSPSLAACIIIVVAIYFQIYSKKGFEENFTKIWNYI